MPPNQAQIEWVSRVLGVSPSAFGSRHANSDQDGRAVSPEQSSSGIRKGKVAFTQARLAWVKAQGSAQSELQVVEGAILQASQNTSFAQEANTNVKALYDILGKNAEAVIDALDQALVAKDDEAFQSGRSAANDAIATYRRFLETDVLALALDGNPFHPVRVRAELMRTLVEVQSRLAA